MATTACVYWVLNPKTGLWLGSVSVLLLGVCALGVCTLGSTCCIDSVFANLLLVTAHLVSMLLGVCVALCRAFAKTDAMF